MTTDMIARALAAKAMQKAAGASDKEPLIVTFTVENPLTLKLKADTPYADIVAAVNAVRIVYAFVPAPVGPAFMQLTVMSYNSLIFSCVSNAGLIFNIIMESDSDISVAPIKMLYRLDESTASSFSAEGYKISDVGEPTVSSDAATKGYADNILTAGNSNSVIIKSSTPNSTKKFRITVDDAGAITATEVV